MNSPAQNSLRNKTLASTFFQKNTTRVAKELLGKGLFVRAKHGALLAEIVETEAYLGDEDAASHAFRGPTKRNASMFKSGGTLYVYLIYGINHCINVVTGVEGSGEAVLIRAAKPLLGIEQMYKNRGLPLDNSVKSLKNLLNGPGKLAKAFGIDLQHDGITLDRKDFRLVDLGKKYTPKQIAKTTRIGITKAADLHFRFFVKDSEFVSRRA